MSKAHLTKKDAPKQITDVEKLLGDNDFIVSKTDTRGYITYCNRIFLEMAGYTKAELIGANHNLIRHPDMPRIVGSEDTPGSAGGIAVNGAEVYVADDIIGLIIFDVSDPSSPVAVGIENTPGLARDVTVSGTLAYVADELLGIRVVDISNIR